MSGNFSQASGQSITLIPVTTDATYSIGPMLIAFLILVLLIGIALYLFTMNHHNEYDQGGGHMIVEIFNETELIYHVNAGIESKLYILSPKAEAKLSISQHDLINAYSYNYDGTRIHHQFRVSNPKIKKLYITPSGFRSNLSGNENVIFVNEASFPVMFIEKSSKGGRRWISGIVPPYSSIKNRFVGKRTTWQVANPSYEDDPIAELTISGKADKVVFDGQNILSF